MRNIQIYLETVVELSQNDTLPVSHLNLESWGRHDVKQNAIHWVILVNKDVLLRALQSEKTKLKMIKDSLSERKYFQVHIWCPRFMSS